MTIEIGYLSECAHDYSVELRACDGMPALRALMDKWGDLVADAGQIVAAMTDDDWGEFRAGLKRETRGRFAGNAWAEKYAAVAMPDILFKVSLVASRYHVPWGTAFIRMREEGVLGAGFVAGNDSGG